MSSNILSAPLDVSRYGLIYAGAQKNIGPAGVTLVVVREDLLGHALPACPSAFDYRLVAQSDSMYNTPPTYGIYMAGLTFQWLKAQGGVAEMERRNIAKAHLLYDFIDGSQLYVNRVAVADRSRMNVPFFLRDESRNEARRWEPASPPAFSSTSGFPRVLMTEAIDSAFSLFSRSRRAAAMDGAWPMNSKKPCDVSARIASSRLSRRPWWGRH